MSKKNNGSFIKRYGTWAVVTGASSGIGRAVAREAAARGINVLLAARRVAEMEIVAAEIKQNHGVETKILSCDFGDPAATESLLAACSDLDIGLFVASAGFGRAGAFLGSDVERDREMLAVNCRAVLEQTHYFAHRFATQGRGGIVLFSSIVGYQGVPFAAHYAATKSYIHTLAEGLAVELRPHGVDVIACAPGPVHTGFSERAEMTYDFADDADTVARQTLRGLGRRTIVVPGKIGKLFTYSLAPLPRYARTRIMGVSMQRISKSR